MLCCIVLYCIVSYRTVCCRYGKVNVSVTVKVMRKKDEIQTAPIVMKLKKFLYDYLYEDWYLASTIPRQMMGELPVSSSLPACLPARL